jgi:pimeloyl-ACP methyl ester carboxylesterase
MPLQLSHLFQWWRSENHCKPNLILINGLAGHSETWVCNLPVWSREFEVFQPELVAYEADWLHQTAFRDEPIDVHFLVRRLAEYLEAEAIEPPFNLVANSLGGKVAVEFALKYPHLVRRLALLGPSGMSPVERMPIVAGVRRGDMESVVSSVFFDRRFVRRECVHHYQTQVKIRRWKSGLIRTIRGTIGHTVRERVRQLQTPTLFVIGKDDKIIDADSSTDAARTIPDVRVHVFSKCGHAPQIEKSRQVNRLVRNFMIRETV